MTVNTLLSHMTEWQQEVIILVGKRKEFEGTANSAILQLPNCLLNKTVRKIGSVTMLDGATHHSAIVIITEE